MQKNIGGPCATVPRDGANDQRPRRAVQMAQVWLRLAKEQDESYQSSQTLTHAACAPPRHSLPLRLTPERFQVEFLIPINNVP
jgi:hypothetical protein